MADSGVVRDDALVVAARHPDKIGASAEMLRHLGHYGGQVVKTASGARWFPFCSCGWVGTTSGTEVDSMGKLVHHLRLVLRAWKLAGVPLLAMPPAPPADWAEVRRRNAHFDAFCKADKDAAARLHEMASTSP